MKARGANEDRILSLQGLETEILLTSHRVDDDASCSRESPAQAWSRLASLHYAATIRTSDIESEETKAVILSSGQHQRFRTTFFVHESGKAFFLCGGVESCIWQPALGTKPYGAIATAAIGAVCTPIGQIHHPAGKPSCTAGVRKGAGGGARRLECGSCVQLLLSYLRPRSRCSF